MAAEQPTVRPLRTDADAWETRAARHTLLAIAHNVTAATRLLEVLAHLATDARLQVVFTCTNSSAFTDGTDDFLRRQGVMVTPWPRAVRHRFDLVIAASFGGELHELQDPLVVVPHGLGYNKYGIKESKNQRIKESKNQRIKESKVFGLSSPWLLHDGRLVPTVVVLSHQEQLDRLRDAVPQATQAAAVVGDPCLDLLVSSRPLRESYRQALGVRWPQQKLVVVTSTWGRSSLYGRHPSLPARLAAALPLDEYRVVVALHPNIAAGHSRWQLDQWLDGCRRAGAMVLRDQTVWRQALVAADLTVGDHGSVTFYSAALGTPVLLASAPVDQVDPRSAVGRLVAVAPRLVASRDLRTQIDEAIADHDPTQLAPITDLATSHPGRAGDRLREVVYDLLDMAPPPEPPDRPLLPLPAAMDTPDAPGAPDSTATSAGAQLVEAIARPDTHDGELAVEITRYGVGRLDRWPSPAPAGHLVVDVGATNTRLLELGDVVVHTSPLVDAERWIAETLRALPGCSVALGRAGAGTWLAGEPGGGRVRFEAVDDSAAPVAFASALLAWLTSGHDVDSFPARVRLCIAGATTSARAEAMANRGTA